ncbi:MAG TPA: hypothetical protein VHL79_24335 [Ramlibacter sp.]|jgi:hypothetical protein|nr:hypothetical protein [Ramlibacter sp.]
MPHSPQPRSGLVFLLLAAVLVSACGGGGGGSDGGGPASQVVVLPPPPPGMAMDLATVKKVAGEGYETMTNGASVAALVGVVAGAVAASLASGTPGEETLACAQGGTLAVRSRVAQARRLGFGDTFSFDARNCKEDVQGIPAVLNGSMEVKVQDGEIGVGTVRLNAELLITSLSLQSAGSVTVFHGDMKVDFYTGGLQTRVWAQGSKLRIAIDGSTLSRTTEWAPYELKLDAVGSLNPNAGGELTTEFTGFIVTTDGRLGPLPLHYGLSGNMRFDMPGGEVRSGEFRASGRTGETVWVHALSTANPTPLPPDPVGVALDLNNDSKFEYQMNLARGDILLR